MPDSLTVRSMPTVTGKLIIPAYDCQYPPSVKACDLLCVDFDQKAVVSDGLYLVEILGAGGVTWRGCRRFQRKPRLHMDMTGYGEWEPFSLDAYDMRIAGFVEQVYKPS